MIVDDLERLADRGPHRDPAEVIASALAEASSPAHRVPRRCVAVSAAAGPVALLVAGLASLRDSDAPDTTEPVAATPVPTPRTEVGVTTSQATQGVAGTACPAVDVSWPDRADGPTMEGTTIRSDSIGATVDGYQLASDPFVFLGRGGSLDDPGDLTADQQAAAVPVTVNGFATEVRPAAAGAPGQSVWFVFPPTASPSDPCNVWTVIANSPMDVDDFVGLLGAVDMELVDDPATGSP